MKQQPRSQVKAEREKKYVGIKTKATHDYEITTGKPIKAERERSMSEDIFKVHQQSRKRDA